jgi:hypothetical protein
MAAVHRLRPPAGGALEQSLDVYVLGEICIALARRGSLRIQSARMSKQLPRRAHRRFRAMLVEELRLVRPLLPRDRVPIAVCESSQVLTIHSRILSSPVGLREQRL